MDQQEFDKLSETGKFRAIQQAETCAEQAEEKLDSVRRLWLSLARFLFAPDDLMDAALRWGEKDAKTKK